MSEEITLPPGVAEAMRIRECYKTALGGMRAFVEMGFLLLEVKEQLPHGSYLPWCEKHLSGLGRRHLHRAKSIAEGIAKELRSNGTRCVTFADLPPATLEMIDEASEAGGCRALLATVHEFRSDELETKNRDLCEARWKADPELRDEWEPRVLSGEVTYTYAMRGMTGQELKGAPRPRVDYGKITLRNLTSQPIAWKHWDSFPAEDRNEILLKVPALIEGAPMIVLATLQKEIERRWKGDTTQTA